jgi:hypothetical protein
MEWKTIDTCPMDEEPMDIWSVTHGRCVDMVRVDAGRGNIWWQADTGGDICVRDVTHWMRVSKPNAPADQTATAGKVALPPACDNCGRFMRKTPKMWVCTACGCREIISESNAESEALT